MKIKTSELIGPALDWAVAKCEGMTDSEERFWVPDYISGQTAVLLRDYTPSKRWVQGGLIIEREKIDIWPFENEVHEDSWGARMLNICISSGPTPLIAAMRCYVASKLGDEVDVPEELWNTMS